MKHEWRKAEKGYYLPKNKPEIVDVPKFKFFTIEGHGNPNNDFFAEYITVLYYLSYGVKMSVKKGIEPQGYFDYTVYPLEGIWDISEAAKKSGSTELDKNELVFKLMIRQPDFVDSDYAEFIMEKTKREKQHKLLEQVHFEEITDGPCVQMLHLGSYDNEPETFQIMTHYAEQENYLRISKIHREIYLSDTRKVSPEKLKTVLRFRVEKK